MTDTKIKRSLVKTFLNTGTLVSPVWSLIGTGVPEGKIEYNPKTSEEIYVHEETATIDVESYAPGMPVEAVAVNGDAVFEFIDAIRKTRATLDDAQTEIVNVWLYETAALGYYLAEKQLVNIQIDDFGGEGGQPAKISYTITYVGDPTFGQFNPTPTAAFVANPVLAGLTSLAFTTLVLTPTFDTNKLFYAAPTTDATNVITVVAVDLVNSVIVMDVDATPVLSGAACTWAEGLNIVTVEVTNGTEVVEYVIHVTYTPA